MADDVAMWVHAAVQQLDLNDPTNQSRLSAAQQHLQHQATHHRTVPTQQLRPQQDQYTAQDSSSSDLGDNTDAGRGFVQEAFPAVLDTVMTDTAGTATELHTLSTDATDSLKVLHAGAETQQQAMAAPPSSQHADKASQDVADNAASAIGIPQQHHEPHLAAARHDVGVLAAQTEDSIANVGAPVQSGSASQSLAAAAAQHATVVSKDAAACRDSNPALHDLFVAGERDSQHAQGPHHSRDQQRAAAQRRLAASAFKVKLKQGADELQHLLQVGTTAANNCNTHRHTYATRVHRCCLPCTFTKGQH